MVIINGERVVGMWRHREFEGDGQTGWIVVEMFDDPNTSHTAFDIVQDWIDIGWMRGGTKLVAICP